MKLFFYSYFAVIRERLWGGAQLMISEILSRLVQRGVQIRILCPAPAKNDELLSLPNVTVIPELHEPEGLKRPLFPHEHAHNMWQCNKGAQWADVIWTHDRTFPLRTSKPVVLSLDNLSYFEEMESLTRLMWDTLIVSSQYLLAISNAVAGPEWWDGAAPDLQLVPFGIDTRHFRPVAPEKWARSNGLPPGAKYILFPHRPDSEKGFATALKVISWTARNREPYKLLIPVTEGNDADARYYEQLRRQIARLRIQSDIIFHPWVPFSDLPAYYSFGSWCLAPGTVPEGFGLTPLQAVSCGTPVIATRAGAMGELFPEDCGVRYVEFDDIKSIVALLKKRPSQREIQSGQCYVRKRYDIERVAERFLEVFRGARKCSGRFQPPAVQERRYQVPPWCRFVASDFIWHDYYRKGYRLNEQESHVIRKSMNGELVSAVEAETQADLVKRGFLFALPRPGIDERFARSGTEHA